MKTLITIAATALSACLIPSAGAQNTAYPERPVRLVVPFSPGGALDVVARMLGQKFTDAWGKPVLIDNRVGAGGNIGAEFVARAAPDGYTLLMSSVTTMAINMSLPAKPPYDFERDYAPAALNSSAPLGLMIHPALPARSVKEFIALAKARPGDLHYFSSGVGTGTHLAGVLFDQLAGVRTTHIPYKGGGQGVIDLLSGQVQFAFSTLQLALPHEKSGRIRLLGIGSAKRYPRLPGLPAVAETVKGYEAVQLYGIVAPRGTPQPILEKIAAQTRTTVGSADVQERLLAQGIVPSASTPDEFSRIIKQNIARFGGVIKKLDLKVQ
ncbi:MAG: Bug family tripartite tricarboxylate transporter substrate binding protein [Burkholderiales bacterium]